MVDDFAHRVSRARDGDPEALEALLAPHLASLTAFVRVRSGRDLRRREGADDLTQSVCRQVVGGIASFRGTTEAEFKRWLYTSALNKIHQKRDHHGAACRDIGREVTVGFDTTVGHDALLRCYGHDITPGQLAIAKEEVERIEAAFELLSDEHREVLTLARFAGLSSAEIAARLEKSEPAVRKILSRARARLAMLLAAPEGSA